jgi:hypothetical protein
MSLNLRAYELLRQIQNSSKKNRPSSSRKPAKIVPIVSKKKAVKFETEEEEEGYDVKEIDIPSLQGTESKSEYYEITKEPSSEQTELSELVRQLVLLDFEESKAYQFLEYIQRYNCFDKQDQSHVRYFLEQIQHEKKSLHVVLSNYGSHIQPLITMMTIAERRITFLEQTNLITPQSTLHSNLLDKQKQLQAIIDEACDHIHKKK